MLSACLERHTMLTELIDQAAMDFSMAVAMDAFDKDAPPKTSEEVYRRTRNEKISLTALRALRLHTSLELISLGQKQFAHAFQQDFEYAVDAYGWLTGAFPKTPRLVSETAELLLLPAPDARARFLSALRSVPGMSPGDTPSFDFDFFHVAAGMADCYRDYRLPEALQAMCKGILLFSEEKNASCPGLHRIVIVSCMAALADLDAPFLLESCTNREDLFSEEADTLSAHFYWYYAFSLMSVGRLEDALPLLLRSSELSFRAEGAHSWMGAKALAAYHRILFWKDRAADSEAPLWDFLKNIKAGCYAASDEEMRSDYGIVLCDLLRRRMDRQELKHYFSEIQEFYDFCAEHEEELEQPRLTVCFANTLLSAYYLEIGNYLEAEQRMLDVLHGSPPEGVEKVPSESFTLSNLLQIYTQLNDIEKMNELADLLVDALDDEKITDEEFYRFSCLIQSTYAQLGSTTNEEYVDDLKKALQDVYDEIQAGDTQYYTDGGATLAYDILCNIIAVCDVCAASDHELGCYREILQFFLSDPRSFPFNNAQLMILYMQLSVICLYLKDDMALHYSQRSLTHSQNITDFNAGKLTALRIASLIYYLFDCPGTAVMLAEESLRNITDAWHNVISYLSDRRICQILDHTQGNYNNFYAIISAEKSPEHFYNQLLRYKDLPALVGRERNRHLKDPRIDQNLRRRVYALQDKLANARMAAAISGEDTIDEISEELQIAEAEFARKFPRDIPYTDISFDAVGRKLKDGEGLIEYYFSPARHSWLGIPDPDNFYDLDIFVLTKTDGQVHLAYTRLAEGSKILSDAEKFTDILQNPEDSQWLDEKEDLREKLHRALLGFPLEHLSRISTLYIAPDLGLCNLPFEILHSDGCGLLQETYRVCRLVCGRDLLYFDDTPAHGSRSFVLGDPDFDAERGEPGQDRFRHAVGQLEPVCDLPFSRIEAQRVARRCRTTPYVGRAATKYALQQALPCRIIHIATHGMFDAELESDSLYSSSLIFAGYNRWIRSKVPVSHCGNGILTADEISRMDLKDTELVVLSACNSGMGDYSARTVRGLLSAFSAAGVRWVINHIWAADDFTTPILMDTFYHAYLTKGMDVPNALQYAKDYLRTVTIGQLRSDGWLNPDIPLSESAKQKLLAMQNANPRRRPFMDESNWGGFVCYKCK